MTMAENAARSASFLLNVKGMPLLRSGGSPPVARVRKCETLKSQRFHFIGIEFADGADGEGIVQFQVADGDPFQ